ncbi:hypothetical protein BKA67DRAFT_320230 [Truncatella angustata]|uniref:Uncharacterized protein n=1 Tax=Truncatella angustata TaxID=152316 RepID=A0A9P8UJT3_9PEZI|nr:uncharacterized protein BKA67DRAFT_320230 [Truncatella angustata]KAH6653406.1 hypothetical protein BKA67DRAFT_320230 [Truncatella angustata]
MATPSRLLMSGEQHGHELLSEYQPFLRTNSPGNPHTSEYHEQGGESPSSDCASKEHDDKTGQETSPWRPTWFHRRVFLMFAAWFAILAASIELLLAFSQKQHGLAEPKGGLFYAWTFGPTAVFVLTAAFWARVEYQSNISMPWMQLQKGLSTARTTIELDYNSKILPALIALSICNRHYIVTIATVTGLALKAVIALSSGLLFLQPGTVISYESSLPLRDALVNRVPLFDAATITSEPYDTFLGILDLNLTVPFGYSPKVAYQTYIGSHIGANDSSSAVVQGIWSDLMCEESDVSIADGQEEAQNDTLTLSLSSTFCDNTIEAKLSIIKEYPGAKRQDTNYILGGYFGPGGGSICRGAGGPVFALGYAWFIDSVEKNSDFDQSMVMFCQPMYYSGHLEVNISETSQPTVEELSSPAPTLLEGDMGWLVRRSYQIDNPGSAPNFALGDWVYNSSGFWPTRYYSRAPDEYPTELSKGYLLLGQAIPTDWRNVTFDSAFHAIKEFYQTFDPLVAHFFLREMKPGEATVEAVVSEIRNRLLVKPVIAHVMGGILGVSAAVLVLGSTRLIPSSGFVPNGPGSFIGAIRNLTHSTEFFRALAKVEETRNGLTGRFSANTRSSEGDMNGSEARESFRIISRDVGASNPSKDNFTRDDIQVFDPLVLRFSVQVAMLSLLIATLISLQISSWISKSSSGVGDIGNNPYLHYTWTTLPTLVMVGIGTYFAASDKEVRVLMPFANLRAKTSFRTLETDFSDRTAAEAMWLSGQTRQWPILVATTSSILVSFLTIFAATLFSANQVPIDYPIQLQQEEWFASFGWRTRDDFSNIILSNSDNFTYPNWTYKNLVLPKLSPAVLPPIVSDNMTVTVVVNALRPTTNCTRHPMSTTKSQYDGNQTASLQIDLTYGEDGEGAWRSGCGLFWRPYCSRDLSFIEANLTPCWEDPAPHYYYDAGVNFTSCSTSQFVWGTINNVSKEWDFLAAYSCTDIVEEVDVELSLHWPSLEINAKRPPRPIEISSRRATRFFPTGDMIHTDDWFEIQRYRDRFVDLSGPRYRLPIESIGDPAAEETVLAAQREHWVLRNTQFLSMTVRRLFNETAFTPKPSWRPWIYNTSWSGLPFNDPFEPPQPRPQIAAIATDHTRYRVVQNEVPTYFLTGLLIAVLLLHSAAIWLVPRDVRPHNFRTIVGIARLLINSNIHDFLRDDQKERSLKDKGFLLDWVEDELGKATYTLQVLE